MSNNIITGFAIIGVGFCVLIAVLIATHFIHEIKEAIARKRWQHKYKHRFDKPPTAKCYCKDCRFHGVEDDENECRGFGGYRTADNWFCWQADPKDKENK